MKHTAADDDGGPARVPAGHAGDVGREGGGCERRGDVNGPVMRSGWVAVGDAVEFKAAER